MYAVMVEGLSGKVDDIVMYLVVTFDDKTYVAVDERVMYIKVLQATVTFILKVGRFNVITST